MAVRWLVRLLVVVMTTIVVFAALGFAWVSIVVATGGGGDECGGGSCGTLGDWDYEHAEYLFFALDLKGAAGKVWQSEPLRGFSDWHHVRLNAGVLHLPKSEAYVDFAPCILLIPGAR